MNQIFFDKMVEGDDLLIVEGDTIKLIGKIAAKTVNADLSRDLWKPIAGRGDTRWELVYFIANPRELDVPFSAFCKLFGYAHHYQLRGFTAVAEEKLEEFYEHYDDLYSILVKLKSGEPVAKRIYPKTLPAATVFPADDTLVEIQPEDIEQVLSSVL